MFKSEIRILGITAFALRKEQGLRIVGAVYRGNKWLDGVLYDARNASSRKIESGIVGLVKKSKHYSQVKAIILDVMPKTLRLDGLRLYERLKKPIIKLEGKGRACEAWSYWGLTREQAEEVLKISRGPEIMPVSLRIARMLAQSIRRTKL